MPIAITHEIEVRVSTEYQPDFSNPFRGEHYFAYFIHIKNHGDTTVQLLRRYWQIFDSNGEYREVEGEGVVGQQPVLEPGQWHDYSSGCQLNSEVGKMVGTYEFIRQSDGMTFTAEIPEFNLVVPYKLN